MLLCRAGHMLLSGLLTMARCNKRFILQHVACRCLYAFTLTLQGHLEAEMRIQTFIL